MKAGDCKKEIGEISRGLRSINIGKRISAPPSTFTVQMCPFPCLTTQKSQSTENSKYHPFNNSFTISLMTSTNSQNHCYRAHDQNKRHQTYKSQWNRHFARITGECSENFVRIRP